MKDWNYNRIAKQAAELLNLLAEKGYDPKFRRNFVLLPDGVKDHLIFYCYKLFAGEKVHDYLTLEAELAPFDKKQMLMGKFTLQYNKENGFVIRYLDIQNVVPDKLSKGILIAKKHFAILRAEDIPTRVSAREMVVRPVLNTVNNKLAGIRCGIVLLFACLFTLSAQGQTFSEWFNQKATQKKYLVQQIAALQVYIGYAKKGYKIAQKGLTTIGNLSKGELDLHTDYLNSLENVKPEIRNNNRVHQIIDLQKKILKDYNITIRQLGESDAFSEQELTYIQRVFTRLLNDCDANLNELIRITTNGELEMKDDERLARIDQLYANMQQNYTFSKGFSDETKMFALVRIREKQDITTGRVLHGINN